MNSERTHTFVVQIQDLTIRLISQDRQHIVALRMEARRPATGAQYTPDLIRESLRQIMRDVREVLGNERRPLVLLYPPETKIPPTSIIFADNTVTFPAYTGKLT